MSSSDNWKRLDVAEAHDDMNREYKEEGTMGGYPSFSELLRIVKLCLSMNGGQSIECLDVGCGAGWQMMYLSDNLGNRISSWTGVDLSRSMCDLGRRNMPEADFHAADFMSWDFERSWDLAMSCGSMLYMPEWRGFLKKMSEASHRFVIVHRTLFTDEETRVEDGCIYHGLKAPVVIVNYDEFLEEAGRCGLRKVERFGEDGESVLLEKTHE